MADATTNTNSNPASETTAKVEQPTVVDAQPVNTAPGSTAPKKKTNALIIVIVGLLVLLCCCCAVPLVASTIFYQSYPDGAPTYEQIIEDIERGSTSNSGSSNGSGRGNTTQGEAVTTAEVGQTKSAGDFSYTLNSVTRDGENYIFDLTVTNENADKLTFSTLLYTGVESDTGAYYNQNLFYYSSSDADVSLDREVEAGAQITGKVVFRVDDEPAELDLVLSGGLFSDDEVSFMVY